MYMAWTIEKITRECENICQRLGYEFNIPVKISGRMTKTLGCVKFRYRDPYLMMFSKSFIENCSDEEILGVIGHECAHYLVALEDPAGYHGHDKYFDEMCKRIGTKYDSAVAAISAAEVRYKYSIYCPNCGFLGGKTKMCKTLENIDSCKCNKCGSKELYYEQNW